VTITTAQSESGLSLAHNSTQADSTARSGCVTFWSDGSLVEVKRGRSGRRTTVERGRRPGGGRRGRVRDWSHQSRLRLLKTLKKVRRDAPMLFATLTYPTWASPSPDQLVLHRGRFEAAFRRRYPSGALVWKREHTKAGVPHLHLLVWPNAGRSEQAEAIAFRNWVSPTWFRVVGTNDERHLRAGTNVERPRDAGRVGRYVGKYVWKRGHIAHNDDEYGRWWAVVCEGQVPWSGTVTVEVPSWAVVRMLRYVRRFAGIKGRQYASLSAFTNDPGQWGSLLAEVMALNDRPVPVGVLP